MNRQQLIDTAQTMRSAGLNQGTAGNLSVRGERQGSAGFWITPTGMDYAALQPDDIPFVEFDQAAGAEWPRPNGASRRKASSEWRLHLDLYRAHPAAGAILHAHSPFATSLACLRREIPPFHYMIARFGGSTVRCAPYALFGSQALSDAAVAAMQDRNACLLANHGMVVCATGLKPALDAAVELEALCEQYWRACQLGEPVLLDAAEMAAVQARFADYGKQD
jgi:L-fuculose-phosphate aldolase